MTLWARCRKSDWDPPALEQEYENFDALAKLKSKRAKADKASDATVARMEKLDAVLSKQKVSC